MPKKYESLVGQNFGLLSVIADIALIPNKPRRVFVRCACGKEFAVKPASLKNATKSVKSCGCTRNHGKQGNRLYSIWRNIKQRCTNPKLTQYKYYGGRGINLCPEWENFLNFYSWAVTNGYADDFTIDRKNNDGDYEPTNCRWVSRTIQNRNKRTLLQRKNFTKFIGVCFYINNNKWASYINVNKRRLHLGYYDTDLAAAIARDTYIVDNRLSGFMMNEVL